MKVEQSRLVERLHDAFAGEPDVRVVAMFGGRAFMVSERLHVSAQASGDLLVRVPADRFDELIARPGAAPATMKAGRAMGRGWVSVSADAIGSDEQLAFWVDVARSSGV